MTPQTPHRFAAGEIVLCTKQYASDMRCKSAFTVVTCMSTDALVPQYRIRSRFNSFERQASEHELTRMAQPQRRAIWMDEAFFSESADSPLDNSNLVPSHHLPRAAWHKNDGRTNSGASYG